MPRVQRPVAHKIDSVLRTNDVKNSEHVDFSALHLSQNVINGLKNSGFERPSPIQLQAIPVGRIGLDLIAQAKSGTGKTCVFGVIILEALNIKVDKCQCLVLAPTREIAAQIEDVIIGLGSEIKGLKCALIIGGRPIKDDKEAVLGTHIIIGTPGRVLHMIEEGLLGVECVRTFVLDEADKLVESAFYSPVKTIADMLPQSKQVLAMSATYDEDIDTKFNSMMRDPYFVRLSSENMGLEGIHHFYFTVKTDPVKHQIFCNKIERLVDVLSNVKFEQCLVFSNYQNRAEEISDVLTAEGFKNQVIAGSMSQTARLSVMSDFRECKFRVLISTDLTARGIDNEHVDVVINLDLPIDTSTYLHRTGRAGRFGKHGAALSIIASSTERSFLRTIEEKMKISVPPAPSFEQISELLRRSKTLEQQQQQPAAPGSWSDHLKGGEERKEEDALTQSDITALRSSVKVTKAKSESHILANKDPTLASTKSQYDKPANLDKLTEEHYVKPVKCDTPMITSMSNLSLDTLQVESAGIPEQSGTHDELSAFPFSSLDLDILEVKNDTTIFSELPTFPEEDEASSGNPSTSESQKTAENETKPSRQRKGSKNSSKKARKPPKSLNCITSPNFRDNQRRAQSATAAFSDNIISPHTPKWRSEAVSTIGCIIHSKAIHVKFLLENYLYEKYPHSEKHFATDYRGYFPTREHILNKSSSSPHEVCRREVSRYVSHGFVANTPEGEPDISITPPLLKDEVIEQLEAESIPQPNKSWSAKDFTNETIFHRDQSFSTSSCHSHSFKHSDPCCNSFSSFSSFRHPCSPHRPTDIPHFCREQSKDSGVFSYSSPHPYYNWPYPPSPYPMYAPPTWPPPPPHWSWGGCNPYPPCNCNPHYNSHHTATRSSSEARHCPSPFSPPQFSSAESVKRPFTGPSHANERSASPPVGHPSSQPFLASNSYPATAPQRRSSWSRCWDNAYKEHS